YRQYNLAASAGPPLSQGEAKRPRPGPGNARTRFCGRLRAGLAKTPLASAPSGSKHPTAVGVFCDSNFALFNFAFLPRAVGCAAGARGRRAVGHGMADPAPTVTKAPHPTRWKPQVKISTTKNPEVGEAARSPPLAEDVGRVGVCRQSWRRCRWELDDTDKAERLLRNLARRLDQEAPGVAASILEGLDEMLTVNRLG